MYEDIRYEGDGPTAVVTNRPASLNALAQLMLAVVRHALVAAGRKAQ